MIEELKIDLVNELFHLGLNEEVVEKVISAYAIATLNYKVTRRECNIQLYNAGNVLDEAIRAYLNCKRAGMCSPGYINNASIMLPRLLNYVRLAPEEYTSIHIIAILARYQCETNCQASTLNGYRTILNSFFQWLVDMGKITRNPVKLTKKAKEEIKEREYLSQLELEEIRDATLDDRSKMLVELLYSTGCRASEVCNIKISDINFNTKTIHLFGKGKKHKQGILNAKAIRAIKMYLKNRPYESEYLFCSKLFPHGKVNYRTIENEIRRINAKVSGKIQHHLHPHLFRHTTATTALQNGMPIQEVQQMLSHASINTTLVYCQTDYGQLLQDHKKYVV